MRGRVSNKCERICTRWKHLLDTVPCMCVCSLSVANFSLKSNIKTAKVSPAVCCRGRSEYMDLKSMPTRNTFSISMYILGVTLFTCMTVHVSQGHFPPFLPSLPCPPRNNFETAHSFKMYVFSDLRMWSCIQICVFVFYQLVLEAHNVPELSAGVNCTFEDLAEMKGLVEGNRIRCSSPAEKEMPRIIVDKGKGGSPVALLHKETPFVEHMYSFSHLITWTNVFFGLKFHCVDSIKIFFFSFFCHQPLSRSWNTTLVKVL